MPESPRAGETIYAMSSFDQYYPIPLPPFIKVPLLTPRWTIGDLWSAAIATFTGTAPRGKLVEEAQELFGSKYVIPTCRGSSALLLGVKALGLGQGDEVIIQSMICRSLAQGIVNAGCSPVFADVGDDYNLDPRKLEACLSPSTRAIVMANMFGKMANVEAIQAIVRRHNIFLVDDAAVSGGASSDGKMSGTFGNFGFVSFNFGKNMIAGGGGLLLTDSEEIYEKAKSIGLTSVARRRMWRHLIYMIGYHRYKRQLAPLAGFIRWIQRERTIPIDEIYRDSVPRIVLEEISPLLCGLALKQLRRVSEIVDRCRKHAQILSEILAHVDEISLPSGTFPEHVFTYYAISMRAGSRFELGQYLRAKGIETKWSYFPLHLQQQYHHCRRGDVENTERLWHRVLYLPADAFLSPSQVEYVGKTIVEYFRKLRGGK